MAETGTELAFFVRHIVDHVAADFASLEGGIEFVSMVFLFLDLRRVLWIGGEF